MSTSNPVSLPKSEKTTFQYTYLESVDSTNSCAIEMLHAGLAKEGSVVIAEKQTGGRGRKGRVWLSPPGGLYYSLVLNEFQNRPITDSGFLIGVAVAQTLKEILPKSHEISLKWPNDILLNQKKVGGILGETVTTKSSINTQIVTYAIIGIGLNVNLQKEEFASLQRTQFPATSLFIENGGGTTNLELIIYILEKKIISLYTLYQEQGFAPIRVLWERNCLHIRKKIKITGGITAKNTELFSKTQSQEGIMLGIDSMGALILMNESGEKHHFISGEVFVLSH